MDRILRYAAYAACAAQIVFIAVTLPDTHRDTDMLALLVLAIPPLLAAAALYSGPDIEERRMMRRIRKIKLQQELAALGGGDKPKAD